MTAGKRPKRYRGYRPPPLWWYKVKYSASAAVLALFTIFSVAQMTLGVLTGVLAVFLSKTDEVVRWSDSPGRFAWQMTLWGATAFVSFAGSYALWVALKGLKGPSAETRL
ncbi:hypothetical protein G7076_02085 [Sphingomonas sp. HDW15A]|uniref:hypothetical protein n=1 Tax=Sphingomonas sp. HDW15A TaxID=2714942 RepID=UPI0014074B16|nr:hypothetical protein [Sphingomonas sp. HDW15A]QIK95436.1 hypothetical protein G7076_02085 [Sphingomonas sp. HDW15A]